MPTAPEHSIQVQLRWRDMDMLGHLNQSVYHELLEEGRIALMSDLTRRGNAQLPGGYVLAHVDLDYHSEVRKDHGHVVVVVRVGSVGNTSVRLEHEVKLPDGTLAASGTSVLVAWDPATRGKRTLSDGERAAFTAYAPDAVTPSEPQPIVIEPGEGHRVGNVEFLARTADTPRFNCGIIEIAAGRELEAHVHREEDDAFYILEGEMTFTFGGREVPAPPGTFVLVPPGVEHGFRNDQDRPVRMLNIHAPAGFDRRIGLRETD